LEALRRFLGAVDVTLLLSEDPLAFGFISATPFEGFAFIENQITKAPKELPKNPSEAFYRYLLM
jgi:hypothetical protein